jgi:hypothetical protein
MEGLREALVKKFEPEFVITLEALPGSKNLQVLNRVVRACSQDSLFDTLELDGENGRKIIFLKFKKEGR